MNFLLHLEWDKKYIKSILFIIFCHRYNSSFILSKTELLGLMTTFTGYRLRRLFWLTLKLLGLDFKNYQN